MIKNDLIFLEENENINRFVQMTYQTLNSRALILPSGILMKALKLTGWIQPTPAPRWYLG